MLAYGDDDVITITDQFNTNNAIETITLEDGNYLSSDDLDLIIQSINAYASEKGIAVNSVDTVRSNQELMNIIASGWHQ